MTERQRQFDSQPRAVGLDDETQFIESLSRTTPGDTIQAVVVDPDQADSSEKPPASSGRGTPAWVGRRLGHFKLLRLLGQGSMGLVIQAEDVNLHRIVALKVLRKRIAGMSDQTAVDQFLREARAAASLEHPNVVRVYEINQHRGWWYIAYEMIEGGNLKAVVKTVGPLPPGRACPVIADAATALAIAHQSGVIHRDVKPSNLMLTRSGRCKLMDFGLVRITDPNDPFDFTDKSVGTPQYMAPEIIRKQAITPAVDIYSLGATLYFALTGRPPFLGKTQREVLQHHLETSPPDIRLQVGQCSPTLAELVERMLAKNPKARPNAAEVAVALRTEAIQTADTHGESNMSTGSFFAMATTLGGSTVNADVDPRQATGPGATQLQGEGHGRRDQALWLAGGMVAVLLIVTSAFLVMRGGEGDPFESVGPLRERFTDTPASYGTRGVGALPLAEPLTEAPPFSWQGKVDLGNAMFVAARDGKRYYRLDDPRAKLISAEQCVGYPSATAALEAGKQPAP